MYRKRLVAIQVLTAMVCAALIFIFKSSWPQVLATFIVMELCGVAGAGWAFRLKSRIEAGQNRLPLERKR